MLRSKSCHRLPGVILALHQAKKVSINKDGRVKLKCLLEVIVEEVSFAFGVVIMKISY